jgi:hypothetical protein
MKSLQCVDEIRHRPGGEAFFVMEDEVTMVGIKRFLKTIFLVLGIAKFCHIEIIFGISFQEKTVKFIAVDFCETG